MDDVNDGVVGIQSIRLGNIVTAHSVHEVYFTAHLGKTPALNETRFTSQNTDLITPFLYQCCHLIAVVGSQDENSIAKLFIIFFGKYVCVN